ncbi:plasmid partitioning protein RepB C-terminal domain-containing protein [Salipiger marinus]|uniref:plasmid partitioning protein RepB C-terminal domain-containing protein n=1 Tax=Salipiger marinus TaxID=555512 RepID=UPI002C91E3E5|nr:plasmid partitioning protein RepB C-terminal domain-containing protein [Salipiger manganoxidans]MEB3421413.1 plasmid partitioning protein RepB C-terminal domain-containing protein [Salipiger manganoxidans]
MTQKARPHALQMIPISQIEVLNPRARNRRIHQEIVDNIDAIGLKRPVTVRRHPEAEDRYDLVCGEGRLQAFRMLGQTVIPAVIIDASEADCMVMSLVENIARRQHRPIDLMREIGSLRQRGYSESEIATKTGSAPSWVRLISALLENGEERLVAAVESGVIPVTLAAEIARAEGDDVQSLLMEAYQAGHLKGKKLAQIRRILEQRAAQRKTVQTGRLGRGVRDPKRRLTQTDLMQLYQREADRQRILVRKSDVTQARLLFIVEAMRDLLSAVEFSTLLREEGLTDMPKALAERLQPKAAP